MRSSEQGSGRDALGRRRGRASSARRRCGDDARGERRLGVGAREVGDRRQAIAAGVALLGPGDVLVVAGKGHEQGQIVGDVVHPFDDVAETKAALEAGRG